MARKRFSIPDDMQMPREYVTSQLMFRGMVMSPVVMSEIAKLRSKNFPPFRSVSLVTKSTMTNMFEMMTRMAMVMRIG